MTQETSLADQDEATMRMLAAQLRRPAGEGADQVARRMDEGNQALILQGYELLAPQAGEALLEVGPGSGAYLERLLAALGATGQLSTADYSPEMVAAVKARYGEAIAAGRLAVHEAGLTDLPFADAAFDGLVSNNTLYFWDDPPKCLAECRRVLRPGGRLVLGFRSKAAAGQLGFTRYGFTLYTPAEVMALLEEHGFEAEAMQRCWHQLEDGPRLDAIALRARRP